MQENGRHALFSLQSSRRHATRQRNEALEDWDIFRIPTLRYSGTPIKKNRVRTKKLDILCRAYALAQACEAF